MESFEPNFISFIVKLAGKTLTLRQQNVEVANGMDNQPIEAAGPFDDAGALGWFGEEIDDFAFELDQYSLHYGSRWWN